MASPTIADEMADEKNVVVSKATIVATNTIAPPK